MNSTVKVVADATTGATVIVSPNNPDFASVRLEQVRTVIGNNNFIERKTVSTLLQGSTTDLLAMGFYAGQDLEGKIVIEESLAPFNKKNPERDLKIAGDTGIVCTVEGSPIYRRAIYSLASNASDTLVKHDNIEQLRTAYNKANQTNSSAITSAASDFNI
jgi:hypothetical protein